MTWARYINYQRRIIRTKTPPVLEQIQLDGAITPTGALILTVIPRLSGSVTPSGALVEQAQQRLSGSVTPTGQSILRANKFLAGSVTPTGALTNAKLAFAFFTGSVTPTGNLIKQAQLRLAGSVTPTGSLVKQVSKRLSGELLRPLGQDAFGGSESGTWGDADIGGAWTPTASSQSVSGGLGIVTSSGGLGTTHLASVSVLDVEQYVKLKQSVVAGESTFIAARATDNALGYHARLVMSGTGANSLNLFINKDLTTGIGSATLSSREGDPIADQFYHVRFRVTGANPTHLQAKAWKDGNAEPGTWDIDVTDSTSAYQVAGWIGLNQNSGGACTFSFDDYVARAPAGLVIQQARKFLTGSVTPIGTVTNAKLAFIFPTGSITPSGALVQRVNKFLTGSSTPTGALINRANKFLAGSITPTGALTNVKAIVKILDGAITPTGALVNRVNKFLAGGTTPSGSLVSQANKRVSGSVTPSGTLANVKVAFVFLTGTITPTGNLIRKTLQALAGAVTPVGTVIDRANKRLSGAVAPSGSLTNQKQAKVTLSGSITPTGSLRKQAQVTFQGFSMTAGSVHMQAQIRLSGIITPSGELLFPELNPPATPDFYAEVSPRGDTYATAVRPRVTSTVTGRSRPTGVVK